jgi:hypothetical protein
VKHVPALGNQQKNNWSIDNVIWTFWGMCLFHMFLDLYSADC